MQALRGRKIAYIGSDPGNALDPTLPVGRQIVEKLKSIEPGISNGEAERRVIRLLDAVKMPSAKQRFEEFPFQFSGGMMQRALIVDALVTNPDLLVADNITQPLDVTVAAQILRLLRELQRDFKTAILFVSSSFGVINEIAHRVLVLAGGRVVETQSIQQLLAAPQHAYTKQLIADIPRIWQSSAEAVADEVSPAAKDVILSVRNVSRVYPTRDRNKLFASQFVHAVRDASFDVRRGDNLAIVGESGCGKSTLSRLLSRLEVPDSGQILFMGEDIAPMKAKRLLALRRKFQLLLQDPFSSIPPHLSIGRTIAEPLYVHGGMSRSAIRDRVAATMQEVGLSLDLFGKLPVGLSAGQRQRVSIARALVLDPELLILDETLSALDQVEQRKLLALFQRLQDQRGMTYIYISHDLGMVRQACNRIAVMYLGRVVELADNRTTFIEPRHPYTRALLSAVPAVEERPFKAETYLLEGEPPNPIHIPAGCSFRSRCPFAVDKCALEDPPLFARGRDESTACHLTEIDPHHQ
ncbi:ABC transporter ATP-binding protein [Bradyrhizobium japonicum]|nr:ABC transporter ATP-binding protein [Bradyrhizobium japonicum]MEB2671231.1 ABC transporter ATP-binding protein [Bradyrhizobium japonicum]WLB28539.1 ABC transporter ATP-binding protein [Bradyrhizobium japonicum]WRI90546.1 ABC transporter ATP-binding protein [Bradyrhizobium japonicum]WRJ84708.1 ABC transporter ATP-binding protein [Bradyrhizobium japonicum]WRJ93679.1 ABC transporter ATP-binding protein [Bradyrhizobium japonicum]